MADQRFAQVFLELRSFLQKYGEALGVSADTSDQYIVKPPDAPDLNKMGFFAGLYIRKNYVSLYLAPVYVDPRLLDGISPALKKRMQGRSCFNFAKVDNALFVEMDELVARSFERFNHQEGHE
jgi:hypothetical protein